MLVDDDVAHEAETRRHVEVADPMGLLAGAPDQHRLTHHRRAHRRTRYYSAALVHRPSLGLDSGIADLARDPELVAAGEEDAGGVVEHRELVAVAGPRALLDIELDQLSDAQVCERPLI